MSTVKIVAIIALVLLLVVVCGMSVPSMRHRRYRKKAVKVYSAIQTVEDCGVLPYLRKINPYVFEELVLYAFQQRGFKIFRNKRYSGDGGIDGKVKINGVRYLIQDKRYKGYVHLEHVEAFETLCRKKHSQGLFVHTGKTGGGSKDVARESENITIISGNRLVCLLKQDRQITFL